MTQSMMIAKASTMPQTLACLVAEAVGEVVVKVGARVAAKDTRHGRMASS